MFSFVRIIITNNAAVVFVDLERKGACSGSKNIIIIIIIIHRTPVVKVIHRDHNDAEFRACFINATFKKYANTLLSLSS